MPSSYLSEVHTRAWYPEWPSSGSPTPVLNTTCWLDVQGHFSGPGPGPGPGPRGEEGPTHLVECAGPEVVGPGPQAHDVVGDVDQVVEELVHLDELAVGRGKKRARVQISAQVNLVGNDVDPTNIGDTRAL